MRHEETLFGNTPPTAMFDDGGGGLNLGCVFSCDVPGELRAFRYYGRSYRDGAWSANAYADHWGALYDNDGSILLFVPFERHRGPEPPDVDGWRNHWIHPSFPIEAGHEYVLDVYLRPARYGFTGDLFGSTYTSGHLQVFRPSEGSPPGRFVYDDNIRYPDGVSTAAYGVDLVVAV